MTQICGTKKTDSRGRCGLYIVSIAGSEEAGRPGRQIRGVWRVHRLVRGHYIRRFEPLESVAVLHVKC